MADRFKNRTMQRVYETVRALAADKASEMWYDDGRGGHAPHRGASHRCAYWDGRLGNPSPYAKAFGTPNHAAYVAGRDDMRVAVKVATKAAKEST